MDIQSYVCTPKISWNIRFSWPHLHSHKPALHIHTGRYFWDNLIHLNIDSIFFWSVSTTESVLKWEKKNYFLSQVEQPLSGVAGLRKHTQRAERVFLGWGQHSAPKLGLPLTAHLPPHRTGIPLFCPSSSLSLSDVASCSYSALSSCSLLTGGP